MGGRGGSEYLCRAGCLPVTVGCGEQRRRLVLLISVHTSFITIAPSAWRFPSRYPTFTFQTRPLLGPRKGAFSTVLGRSSHSTLSLAPLAFLLLQSSEDGHLVVGEPFLTAGY